MPKRPGKCSGSRGKKSAKLSSRVRDQRLKPGQQEPPGAESKDDVTADEQNDATPPVSKCAWGRDNSLAMVHNREIRLQAGSTFLRYFCDGNVNNLLWSPDGSVLAACFKDDSDIFVWRLQEDKILQFSFKFSIHRHTDSVLALAWCPVPLAVADVVFTHILACTTEGGFLALWDGLNGALIAEEECSRGASDSHLVFSPDGLVLLHLGETPTELVLWDVHRLLRQERTNWSFYILRSEVASFSWHSADNKVAICCKDGYSTVVPERNFFCLRGQLGQRSQDAAVEAAEFQN